MEDIKVSNKKLLVARSKNKYRKIYRWLQYISKNEKLYKDTSGKVYDK